MKKSLIEIVKLDKIVPGGQALGTLLDGRKVFVWGALPGETARVELTKVKKSYAEGVAVEILESSPQRIAPRDTQAYLSTSPWQIMPFEVEQQYKLQLIRDAFLQEEISLPDTTIGTVPMVATDGRDYFYRNKMEYSLWWDNETAQISLAFHKRGTHQKIPITGSSIERPEIFAEAARIVADLNARSEEARKYQSLLVRCNQSGEVVSALFENGQPHPHMKNLTDEIMGQKYSYSPNGFFQINLPVYEMALAEITRWLGSAEKVVDMYAGVGTIGLSVARDRDLTLVETNDNAFKELVNNASTCVEQSLPFTVHATSENALEYITHDITLILDPPRAGLDEKVVARILDAQPPRVIYLSCNPATQARDVAKLLAKYKISHHQAFNFFPRTPHIENLIVLTQNA
jgi:23S rRNA (uracil1939-C5)-methyltransferase